MALILLIDDEEMVRDVIRHTLADEHMIVEASTGLDALRLVKLAKPSLVILDIHLGTEPEGPEVCKILHDNPTLAGMPILAISGWADRDEISNILIRDGAVTFLDKPFTPTELVTVVTYLLAQNKGQLARLINALGENALTNEIHAAITNGNSYKIVRSLEAGIALAKAEFVDEEKE
jgi:DNA-binding response OmpR family regulator